MSTVTTDDVRHLAALSALALDDEQIEALRVDLGNILDYIGQLSDLDTTGVTPSYQVTGLNNVMRRDVVEPGEADSETLLKLAPDARDNQVKVPKVL